MILLNTDTLTLLMRDHPALAQRVRESSAIGITLVTRIEILLRRFASVLKAADSEGLLLAQHWLEQNERFMESLPCMPFDTEAAAYFDQLKNNKRVKSIGRADLLIACIALAHRATLVTRNLRHFQQVSGLRVENWVD